MNKLLHDKSPLRKFPNFHDVCRNAPTSKFAPKIFNRIKMSVGREEGPVRRSMKEIIETNRRRSKSPMRAATPIIETKKSLCGLKKFDMESLSPLSITPGRGKRGREN